MLLVVVGAAVSVVAKPLAIIESLRQQADSILVGVSCGIDSVVTLDLVHGAGFPRIVGYFYYLVRGLSFQERYLCHLENRYGIDILRVPHWQLGMMLGSGVFRPVTASVPVCTVKDGEAYVRDLAGIDWIATGERKDESLERRANIVLTGGLNRKTRRAYPIGFWSKSMVWSWLKQRNIPVSPEYRVLSQSFGRLYGPELEAIKHAWPSDYEQILEVFPHAEVAVKRREFAAARKAAKLRGRKNQTQPDQPRAVQPQDN